MFGCISIATSTPWCSACFARSVQYGIATSSHWYSWASACSVGHGAPGGEPGEAGDGVDAEQVGQLDRLAELAVGLGRALLVGVERVVVGRQRRDAEVVFREQVEQLLARPLVSEVRLAVHVVLARPPADAELDRVDPDGAEVRGRVLDRFAAQRNGQYADVHARR